MAERLPLFATASRGTEELLSAELQELGAVKIRQDRGGVRFHANLHEALQVALWTRIAMRILYPLGEFEAQGQQGLYDAALQVPWEEYLTLDRTFAVDATLRDSEHTHSGFVALKLKDAIVDRLRDKLGGRPNVDAKHPDVRVVAHLAKDKLSLSLDVCGEPLHRRGYRVSRTEAPLKETLAAAMLRAGGYTGEQPLLDPMCGSGTLLAEAALIATRRAPNLGRQFSIVRWPSVGTQAAEILRGLVAEAKAQERKPLAPILGMDKSDDAIDAADANLSAAGLAEHVMIGVGDATRPIRLPTQEPGLLVTNPPYGERLGDGGQKGMKSFYYKLGDSLGALPRWKLEILSGNKAFEAAFHHRPKNRRILWNGPLECELLEYENPAEPRPHHTP